MRKIREILRLGWGLSRGVREIARSVGISHSTVSDVLARAEAAGIVWPLPDDFDDAQLQHRVYPVIRTGTDKPEPDWSYVHRELSRKGVTRELLWIEYRACHPDGYVYSRFCQLYRKWLAKVDVVLRQHHRAGEKMFVDFAGQTVPIVDPVTGEIFHAPVFVATLGASSYTYAEVLRSQELQFWAGAHSRAFEFFGGVTEVVVSDHLKSGVSRSCRYDPDLNPTYQELATHYGTVIIPARPKKPRDKAKVEAAVSVVSTHVLAPLRDRRFFSLQEANQAVAAGVKALNERKFQNLDASRRSLYEQLDRPALKPLPPERYVLAHWKKARVNIDYHIQVESNYYSVPYQLAKEEVDVRFTDAVVEVLFRGKRVAGHVRSFGRGVYVTHDGHRPAAHRKHLEWTPSRLIRWASETGPAAARVVSHIITSKPHPEQGYRACLGIISLGKKYGPERLEAASTRALACNAVSYRSLKSILSLGLDRVALEEPQEVALVPQHANVRGATYYARKGAGP